MVGVEEIQHSSCRVVVAKKHTKYAVGVPLTVRVILHYVNGTLMCPKCGSDPEHACLAGNHSRIKKIACTLCTFYINMLWLKTSRTKRLHHKDLGET